MKIPTPAQGAPNANAGEGLGGWIARHAPTTESDVAPASELARRDELCRSAGFTVPDRHE